MEQNTYEENNVHQLYPDSTVIREKEGFSVMFGKLSTDVTNLWDRQSRLIGTELGEKVTTIKVASGSLVVGGVFAFVGVFCLAATAILALSTLMAPWMAAAIVTVLLMVVGLVMIKGAAKKLSGKELVPEHSIDALNQIKNTFQERIHEFKRQ